MKPLRSRSVTAKLVAESRVTFAEVCYEMRRIFVVMASTPQEALDKIEEAHRRAFDVTRPLLGEETGVYIGSGITREAKVRGCTITANARYRNVGNTY